jgi:plasmid recombination enzyme
MSDHIERKTTPKNADPTRTHLNRELIEFPSGVTNRNEAISHRLKSAGLTRKIGINQVRAIRFILSGSPKDMKQIEQAGKLDEWCRDSVEWMKRTYGSENVVSAVLHMDEETPHIHATLIPIVQTERRKKKSEKLVKKNYRKKPIGAARLSANDIMTRQKLKAYQDGYALAMAKYGLKRGIVGSEARHTTTAQYYRDLLNQTEDIQENIGLLLAEKERAESELAKIKSEARTEQLKNKATDAMTAIASGVGSLFGSGKLKELEQANGKLQGEIDKRDNQIRLLNDHMRMQEERHSTETLCQQEVHRQELNMKVKKIEELNEIIGKAFKWFPIIREMLQMEKFCKSAGFTQEMIDVLLAKRKPIVCSGKLYSTQHRQSFQIKDAVCKIEDDLTEEHKLVLTINRQPIVQWFMEQWEKLQQNLRNSVQREQRSRGFRM